MYDYDEPAPEIGVIAAYGHAWRKLWDNFLILFIIGAISWVISIPGGIYNSMAEDGSIIASIFSAFYSILIITPLSFGVAYAYLRAARNQRVNIGDMFEVIPNYVNAVITGLVVGVIVGIGFICLIIPGIILACKLAFTPYLVVDRKMNVVDAIQESWRMTRWAHVENLLPGIINCPRIHRRIMRIPRWQPSSPSC